MGFLVCGFGYTVPENGNGTLFVRKLRSLALDEDSFARCGVGCPNGGCRFVSVLTARTMPHQSLKNDPRIVESGFLGVILKHGYGERGAMPAAFGFGRRDSLPAVPARFVLEDFQGGIPGYC